MEASMSLPLGAVDMSDDMRRSDPTELVKMIFTVDMESSLQLQVLGMELELRAISRGGGFDLSVKGQNNSPVSLVGAKMSLIRLKGDEETLIYEYEFDSDMIQVVFTSLWPYRYALIISH